LEICSDRCKPRLQPLPRTVLGSPGQKRKWRRDVRRRIAQERVPPTMADHVPYRVQARIESGRAPARSGAARSRAVPTGHFGTKPARKRIKEVIRNGTFVIRNSCRDDRPAWYKSWLSIVALEPSPKVAWSAGLSRCRAQYVDRACGMQVQRVREVERYAVLNGVAGGWWLAGWG